MKRRLGQRLGLPQPIQNHLLAALAWTLLIGLAAGWDLYRSQRNTVEMARHQAVTMFDYIVLSREWNARHGGVYVPISEWGQPNPYLRDPLRDVETVDGLALTKINPAYMTRQISEIAVEGGGAQFKLTSLEPLRPANAPDTWEAEALHAFVAGAHEVDKLDSANRRYHYMAPLRMEPTCMACHGHTGHRVGDIRGGIRVDIDASHLLASRDEYRRRSLWLHGAFLLVGYLGMGGHWHLRGKTRQLEAERAAAEAANEAKSRFLATVSHEIRTPMNAIIGMGDLLLESDLSDEQRRYLQVSRSAGESLLWLINDLLDLSRIEAGEFRIDAYDFDLEAVVGEALQVASVNAAEKGLDVTAHLNEAVPRRLHGDGARLRQILVNLLSNAVKFTPQGEVELCVAPAVGPGVDMLCFSVRDTGIGIPHDQQQRIFAPFVQGDGGVTRAYGGTGLGLAIVQRLVKLLGGTVSVESTPGQGALFQVVLPFATARGTPEPSSMEIPAPASVRPLRILQAEDSPDNALLIETWLRGSPHTIETVHDGAEAVRRLHEEAFDLVLMDIQMPVMDGLSATRAIRNREREEGRAPIPIIALTAHAMREDVDRSLEAGCNSHLTKPLRKSTLLAELARWG